MFEQYLKRKKNHHIELKVNNSIKNKPLFLVTKMIENILNKNNPFKIDCNQLDWGSFIYSQDDKR